MRAGQILSLTTALAACAGPSVSGQQAVRPNIYQIAPEQVAQASDSGFIEVGGSAIIEVPSDEAQVSFAMETRASTAEGAASANAAAMDRVISALRGARFADLDIETYGYSLQPEYSTDNNRVRSIAGYAVFNNIRAKIGDVDDVGRLIDVAVRAGANRVASISFSASDTEPARQQALAEAVRVARSEATILAEALGYRLGAPLEVRGGAQRPAPRPMAFEAMDMVRSAAVPTPIEAGDQQVSANVTIRFALGPAR